MDDLKKRLTLYGFGFFIGILMVFFFLGGKRASCNWLPNDRILNIIRQKKISYADDVRKALTKENLDSLFIDSILRTGDVDFARSRTKNDPCRFYWVDGTGRQDSWTVGVELCDSLATVKSLKKADAEN